ncbi:MAG TPA: hypothetical protein DD490_15375 [Acidobacteria bacterium]|nr:hypothetical protein [Acidobacteriota bacterium]
MSFDLRRLPSAFALCVLALLAGCGKQGNPQPPLRAVPATTQDLKAHQQGPRLLLDFGYPKTTAAGTALDGLRAIEVYESLQPAPREGAPPALDAKLFTASAQLQQTLAEGDVGGATFGDRLILSLPLPEPLEDPVRARYYAVRTVGKSGDRSDLSNVAAVLPKVPPAPPTNVTATARADGIFVEWTPVEGVLGYGVYRRGAQERAFGAPVQLVPGAAQRSWLDASARFGQDYIYAVTAIIQPNPIIESAISGTDEERYTDRFAPPVPADLVALTDAGRVRLVWRASEAEDFAGYVVYRRDEGGAWRRLSEQALPTPEYVDTTVASGSTYGYRVSAVDQAGNESGPGPEVRAVVP